MSTRDLWGLLDQRSPRLRTACDRTRDVDGGYGRVVQVYFDAFASSLSVTGGEEGQFRILWSRPLGQVVVL